MTSKNKMEAIVVKFVWVAIGKKILIDHISAKKEDIEF